MNWLNKFCEGTYEDSKHERTLMPAWKNGVCRQLLTLELLLM